MKFLERDGVRLACHDMPGDGPPVVLVHGWCCDRSYFAPQAAHFVAQGRRVLAVDLRGHGESDKPHQPYPIGGFADDVAWLVERLGVAKPLVIGHSMGGIIAYDLAGRFPELASAIVMIDAAVARSAAAMQGAAGMAARLREPDYRQILRDFVEHALFLPTDDAARRRDILARMADAPQHVAVAAMEGLRDYDPEPAGRGIAVPALYIAADEMPPRTDMVQMHALVPHLQFGQTVGSGHFCQLEVPDQVNAMIDRFAALQRV